MTNFNDWLALRITKSVGSMYMAYLFAVIGVAGIVFAFSGNTFGVLVVGAVSGYFLQLVLLPIIIVGQNIMQAKHDETIRHIKRIHKHLGIPEEK